MAGLQLFDGLSPRDLESLAGLAGEVRYDKGRSIFLEGGEAKGFYIAKSGLVKIFKLAPDGREQIIHIYGPGEPFAEVPVFEGGAYPANAVAIEESVLLFFPRDAIRRLLAREPALALAWLAVLARKLRRFTIQLENLTLKESPQRLAAYLLDLSERSGGADSPEGASAVELDMTKGHLAGLLGTAQETLSRILRKMTEAGCITVKGRRIELLDRPALEALASGDERL
ncbi:MAG: Crp/Fnr family transcriptional regulator [Thermodesulfobacteriota bacterium]